MNKAGSARIVTLRPGVACAELGVELRWRYREREGSTMREPLDMVEDVGDESPALPFYETPSVSLSGVLRKALLHDVLRRGAVSCRGLEAQNRV